MIFNDHYHITGKHSFLSPSKHHWVNYDDERLVLRYSNHRAAAIGTRLHNLAEECITMNVRLPIKAITLNLYVNDAIGFRMQTEKPLYYSSNSFGTADAISFRKNFLRILDTHFGKN